MFAKPRWVERNYRQAAADLSFETKPSPVPPGPSIAVDSDSFSSHDSSEDFDRSLAGRNLERVSKRGIHSPLHSPHVIVVSCFESSPTTHDVARAIPKEKNGEPYQTGGQRRRVPEMHGIQWVRIGDFSAANKLHYWYGAATCKMVLGTLSACVIWLKT